jgi:hypothetical protein
VGYPSRSGRAQRTRLARSLVAALLGAVAALICATEAQAQPVLLSWDAPASCPTAEVVLAKVEALLASDESAPTAQVRARARVVRGASEYRLSLVLDTDKHHAARELRARRCSEFVDTAAWLIALAINPMIEAEASAEPARETSASAPAPGTTRSAGPRAAASTKQPTGVAEGSRLHTGSAPNAPLHADAPRQPSPAPVSTARVEPTHDSAGPTVEVTSKRGPALPRSYRVGAVGGVFRGAGADVQAALGAFAGLSVGWSYTQLRFSGLLPRELHPAPEASARVWSLELELAQCALWGNATVRAGPCLGLAGLHTRASVQVQGRDTDSAALWGLGSAGLQAFWRLPRHVELVFGMGAGLPLSRRPRFIVEGLGVIAAAQPWSLDARLGLAFVGP